MKSALKELQGWLQHEIVRPHEQLARRERASAFVLPTKALTAEERVEIYSTMYRLRMLEALETDYPALHAHLGCTGFEKLMLAYLRKFPSRHYSLNFLGARVPEFLDGPLKLKERAFLADVARVEHAITATFDEPEAERLDTKALAGIAPEAWEKARLALVPALRLLALDHAANAAVTDLRHGRAAQSTKRKPSWVVVYRKDWVVWRMDLERAAFDILCALRDGKPLAKAIEAGAASFDGSAEELQSKIQGWFAEWTSEGFFRALAR